MCEDRFGERHAKRLLEGEHRGDPIPRHIRTVQAERSTTQTSLVQKCQSFGTGKAVRFSSRKMSKVPKMMMIIEEKSTVASMKHGVKSVRSVGVRGPHPKQSERWILATEFTKHSG